MEDEMTYLYAVHGSEDGMIAVATSPTKAVNIAVAYVTQNGANPLWEGSRRMDHAMAHLRRRKSYAVVIESDDESDFASAEIMKFDQNWYGGRDW